jgi:hypothetical protein
MPKIGKTSAAVGLALSAAGLVVLSSWPAEAQQSRSQRSQYYSQQAPSSKVARQQSGSDGNSVYWNGCCGPNSIKLGTDPDPNIRTQLSREATRYFGGGEP